MTNHKSVLPDLLDLGPLLADDGAALRRGHAQPQHQRPRVGGFTENQSEQVSICGGLDKSEVSINTIIIYY